MASVLLGIAAAVVHCLAILGYISVICRLSLWRPTIRLRAISNGTSRVALYAVGAGSIFLAPAYLYGRFKAQITENMFYAFTVTEFFGVILLIFYVKTWNALIFLKAGNSDMADRDKAVQQVVGHGRASAPATSGRT